MADILPHARDTVAAAEDRTDSGAFPPIHPRLQPVAEAKTKRRLRVKLRALCDDAAEQLQAAVAQLRAYAMECDAPEANVLLGELEKALADIQSVAVSELFDAAGLASLERRLTLVSEDLRALSDPSSSAPGSPRL